MQRKLVTTFNVPLKPMPYGRARVCSRGLKPRFFVNPKESAWRQNLVAGVRATWGMRAPLDEPLALLVRFSFPRPQKPRFWAPAVKPDLDNLVKQVKDSLNKIVWIDDCRIIDIVASKQYAESPSIHIEVYRYA